MKPTLYFCRQVLMYHLVMAAAVAADLLLVRIFGQDSIFFIYVNMFQYLFIMMHAIGTANICSLHAKLALGFGATRRQIVVGYTVVMVVSAFAATLLSVASAAATPLVLGPIAEDSMQALMGTAVADGSLWYMLIPMLGIGAVFGWVTILKNRRGWRSVLLIGMVMIAAIALWLVLPLVVLMMTADGDSDYLALLNIIRWVPLVSGLVLFAVFYALTVRALRRLAL